ncbi:MAG: helix-turn-helix transcriptional regulator [Pseudomonadota bacterium]
MAQETLGNKIRKERKKRSISLRKLAENLEIAPAYLVDIEKDRRIPSQDIIQKIADLLDVPIVELQQFGSDIPKPVKEWLEGNPVISKILNLIKKTSIPEKTISDFESFIKSPLNKQPILAIYESELQAIGQESISWDTETGGDLFGVSGEMPIIYLATRSGPNTIRNHAHFRLDVEYLIKLSIDLDNDWGLRYFGDWHSHHRLGLQFPSSGDQRRINQIARKNNFLEMAEMIITFSSSFDSDKKVQVNPYVYCEVVSEAPVEAALIILKGLSPVREVLLKSGGFSEQRLFQYSSFSIDHIIAPREPLGRLQSVEGLPIDQITGKVLRRVILELEKLSCGKIEEHKTQFGLVLVAPINDEEYIGFAIDGKWPHQILQINWINRKTGKTEELPMQLDNATLINLPRLNEIFCKAKDFKIAK